MMTEPAPAQASPPGDVPAAGSPAGDTDTPRWVTRAGTVAMAVAIIALGVVSLDLILRGRLLGPLIRRLPGPAPAAAAAPGPPAGEDDVPTVTLDGLPPDG